MKKRNSKKKKFNLLVKSISNKMAGALLILILITFVGVVIATAVLTNGGYSSKDVVVQKQETADNAAKQ